MGAGIRWQVRLTSARSMRHIEVVAEKRTHVGLVAARRIRRGERITHVTNLGRVEQPKRPRRRRNPVSRAVVTRKLAPPPGKGYSYPPRSSYIFLGAGPWRVELREKSGRRFTWRAGLNWNQAQAAAKAARAANYRDPRIAKRGAR